jgi:hypothetical protein
VAKVRDIDTTLLAAETTASGDRTAPWPRQGTAPSRRRFASSDDLRLVGDNAVLRLLTTAAGARCHVPLGTGRE